MSAFVPLLDGGADDHLLDALQRIGPVLIPAATTLSLVPEGHAARRLLDAENAAELIILVDEEVEASADQAIGWLESGFAKLVAPLALAKQLFGIVPRSRLILLLDVAAPNVSTATDSSIRNNVSGVLLKTRTPDAAELVSSVGRFFTGCAIHLWSQDSSSLSMSTIRSVHAAGASLIVPTSRLTLAVSASPAAADQINVADAFMAPLVSDRPDGLFPTVVSSAAAAAATTAPLGGRALGLVYSSRESIRESIVTGKGVYQSRKHGLWRKGETSGATQDVVRIRADCDSDALEFSVVQHGEGFCHLNRASCFGDLQGLSALEATLKSRLSSAPEGSYTSRLFKDQALLRSKIMEEADELCRAERPEDIAFEAADLFYFALTRCVAAGVGLADIERSLDKKAQKVTRRPGNAKPQWSQPASTPGPSKKLAVPVVEDTPIRMRTANLATASTSERADLLRRPVLKSEEMIAKVKPIVDNVRTRGDAALIELTAKFDKAHLTSTVLRPPYAPESMVLTTGIREAIDKAYENIRKFHAAQVDAAPLVVETMPGVVCTRFARPIARVGLYVPGGTATLPSTALMLGVPAQVAGCHEIVLATPPRPDGSVSPEVMYVAHLVGASAVLKAGGAQAVAAMAYGTESVPKVDKIFGPGNQWVTAAKMLVQNDTEALVSIDMPAGPSEVLVIADETSNPAFVAADLLSQAEHGVDSQVVLVTVNLDEGHLAEIEEEVDKQAHALPRVTIVRESVRKSLIVQAASVEEAVAFSNEYAPEHLILHLRDAPAVVQHVQNAGSVFVGPYTPESCGDYASGTNHTLPTNGYARQFSGVNTQSFQKHITSQEISQDGLKALGPIVATLADCEGLEAHANAVRIRLKTFK